MKKDIQNNKMILQVTTDLIASKVKDFVSETKQFVESNEVFDEVILDLVNVTIIDSIGISFIIGLYKSALNNQKKFQVTNASSDIKQLFELMKLNDLFQF